MALLRSLRIRNLVIIDDLAVEFGDGLNLLTGETGAGKSILVDALGLISGARADRSLVRTGEPSATVEALFDVASDSAAARWLADRGPGAPEEGQVVVRREIAVEGAGRVQINGSPSTVGMLRELAERLLELHGQHDPRSLMDGDRHLELLDGFGGNGPAARRVREAYDAQVEAESELHEIVEAAAERERRIVSLRETVREIDELAPAAGELQSLERERRVLQNAARMAEWLDEVVGLSYDGEPSAVGLASRAAARAEQVAELDETLAEAAERIRVSALELEDAATVFRDYRERADFDPARLEGVESRRVALERACCRHAADEAELLEIGRRAAAELQAQEGLEARLAEARGRVATTSEEYVKAAGALTRRRVSASRKLESAVERQFAALALGKAQFRVELPPARGGGGLAQEGTELPVSPRGAERAEFLLAANPGEPLRPLRQVASGGELSRVMLALHVVNEERKGERALVFDEIDTGVSGAVADAVGARLQRLARSRQLLCVTHLPQVAAYADRHFRVRKSVAGGRTRAGIVSLDGGERVEELARMLGGKGATTASRKHASDLLLAAGRESPARPRSEA